MKIFSKSLKSDVVLFENGLQGKREKKRMGPKTEPWLCWMDTTEEYVLKWKEKKPCQIIKCVWKWWRVVTLQASPDTKRKKLWPTAVWSNSIILFFLLRHVLKPVQSVIEQVNSKNQIREIEVFLFCFSKNATWVVNDLTEIG